MREHFVIGLAQWFLSERARALKFLVPAGARDAAAIKSSKQQQQAACLAWCNARCNGWLRHLLGASLSHLLVRSSRGERVYERIVPIAINTPARRGRIFRGESAFLRRREGGSDGRSAQQRVLDQHLLAFCDAPCGFDTKQELLL